MKAKELIALFNNNEDEFLKFDRVKNPLSSRPDIHAFLLLDKKVPGTSDMVCSASHDEIFLEVEPDELAEVVSTEEVIDLIRCGVRLDREYNSFAMFV